ncbi:MAG: hypothetical protein L6R42_010413, partial [Xanthoria sp. 1 TBL-2021]
MSSEHFNEHDLTVLSDRDSLSNCLRELGDYAGAIKLDEVTLPIRQKLEEDTIATLQSLADNLSQIGNHKNAIPLNRSALATRIETRGKKHEDTLETQHNLASSLYDPGQAQEASILNAQILKAREERLAADDDDLIATGHNLATNHYALGNLKQAAELTNQNLPALQNTRTSDDAQLLAICGLQDRIKSIFREAERARAGAIREVERARAIIHVNKQVQAATKEESKSVSGNRVETRAQASEFRAGLDTLQRKPKATTRPRKGESGARIEAWAEESKADAETRQTAAGSNGGNLASPGVLKQSSSCPEETGKMAKTAQQSENGNGPFRARSFGDPNFEVDRPKILRTASEKKQRITNDLLSASSRSNVGTKVRPRSSHDQIASRLEPKTLSTPITDKPRSRSVGALSEEQNTKQSKWQAFSDMCDARDARSRKVKGPRVRIAILDTGIDLSHPHFDNSPEALSALEQQQSGPRRHRVKESKSFVGGAAGDRDNVGHGTHCAALLLELAPNADIYVARVCEERTKKLDPDVVAK